MGICIGHMHGNLKKYKKNIEKLHRGHMGKNGGHHACGNRTFFGHMGKYGGHMNATYTDRLTNRYWCAPQCQ
jgi:hypothetical protein